MKQIFHATTQAPLNASLGGVAAGWEYSQSTNQKTRQHLRRLFVLAAVGGAMSAAPIIARAGTTTLDDPQVTTQSVTTDPDSTVIVNTTNDFSVNTNAGDALTISGAGNIIYDDGGNNNDLISTDAAGNGLTITSTGNNAGPPPQNGSVTVVSGGAITGGNSGIYAANNGTGDVSVTATGIVFGNSFNGIDASNNNAASGNVTVNAATVTGGDDGIKVVNAGTGFLSVTATGIVIGAGNNGINAFSSNAAGTGGVTVEVADVTGANTGISAENTGFGGTSVTATGTVIGSNGSGILAGNFNSDTAIENDLTVNAATVTGTSSGIFAINNGTGSTSITATGTVTATDGNGISVNSNNAAGVGDVTLNVTDVTGSNDGIFAINAGTGAISVTATGTVIGAGDNGIVLFNDNADGGNMTVNAATVTGSSYGIFAINGGTGAISVTATGTVTGAGEDGIFTINSNTSTGDVTINAASVTGADTGIYAINNGTGALSVTATGNVTSQNGTGIYGFNSNFDGTGSVTVNAVDVDAVDDGIVAVSNSLGDVSATSTGTITTQNGYGIYVYNNNSDSTGDVTIKANTVNAASYALDAESYGTGNVNVTAMGTITSQNNDGIYAYIGNSASTGNITINAIDINAFDDGVYATNYGLGGISVTSTGTITTLDDDGIDVQIENSDALGNITVNAVNVNATDVGIDADNEGLGGIFITATGTVTSAEDDGIYAGNYNADGTGDVVVNANNVSGLYGGIVVENDGLGNVSVTATGTVTAAEDDGIYASNTNADGTGSVTVKANNVSALYHGIHAGNYGLGSTSVTATGTVTSSEDDGIYAINTNADGTGDVSVNANNVTGNLNGINAENDGSGNTFVSSTGTVIGTTEDGIFAVNTNTDGTGNVTVNANNVTGNNFGITARNTGLGNISVTSTGTVIGTQEDGISISSTNVANTGGIIVNANNVTADQLGISAINSGLGATNISSTGTLTTNMAGLIAANLNESNTGGIDVNVNNAFGAVFGISVQNFGIGQTSVTSSGNAIGSFGAGIAAVNINPNNTSGLSVNANNASGDGYAILAGNLGLGATNVVSTGIVSSASGAGIIALNNNAAATGNIAVSANIVTGGNDGIHIDNNGLGGSSVTATGLVTSIADDGIEVLNTNPNNTSATTINAASVKALDDGIFVRNQGSGNIGISATGTVTSATDEGIEAYNNNPNGNGNIAISAVNVAAFENGIYAENDGFGSTSITATGNVSSANNDGIFAANNNAAGTGTVKINAKSASGKINGIHADNQGTGAISVTTGGEVQGGENAVKIESFATPNSINLTVNNESVLRNSSNSTASNAVTIQGIGGSATVINNNGLIRGNAQLGNENDTFNNNRIWNNTGGTSNFGGGNDTLNNTGAFIAAAPVGVSNTNINGIETVNQTGALVLQNNDARIGGTNAVVGDRVSFGNGGSGVFNANGGVLLVDTNLGAQTSDELAVDNLAGNLFVDVNAVDAADLGQPTIGDGVRIVEVRGTSDASVAVLVRPVTGGLYSYQLNRGLGGSPSYFLQSAVRSEALAGSVLSVLGSRTALSTLSNVNERQRDVGVLPADAPVQRGVWGRIFGASTDYNSNKSGNLGYDSNTYGAQAGVDLLASTDEKGNRKYGGLYVAYASSNGDVNSDGGKIGSLDLNAATLGAYYSLFSQRKWYFDAVAQYSLLGGARIKTGGENISPDGSSYALSIEAGRKMQLGKKYANELQGQLIYQNTSLDDAKLNDGTRLRLSNTSAVTGRIGVRLYGSESGSEKGGAKFSPWLRANLWHTFNSDSTISSQGNSFSTPLGGTSGELELGFSKGNAASGKWSTYGSVGYLFDLGGAEYSGWKGTIGVRKGF